MPTLVFGQDVNRQKLHQQLDEAAARDAHKLNHWHRPVVGYSPVIVIVPQGVGMGVSAVVSADRRYVRIGTSPMFSSVGQVYIFNYQR